MHEICVYVLCRVLRVLLWFLHAWFKKLVCYMLKKTYKMIFFAVLDYQILNLSFLYI